MKWNWAGKMRSATAGSDTIKLKYDPLGRRVYRQSDDGSTTVKRHYIMANINGLSQILLEIDVDDPNIIEKAYVYADNQVLLQYDGDPNDSATKKYFYLHDRLGSIRMILDEEKNVEHRYTYKPFGEALASKQSAAPAP